jgi:dTDP-4-dehydrorhamnose 3,5-epimerase-like enzyme
VLIEPLQIHPDDRGFFAELARPVSLAAQLFMSFFPRMNFANAVMSLLSWRAGALAAGTNSVQKKNP